MGHEEEKHFGFSSFYCLLFPFHKRKSMFAVLHSDINSLKPGLLHLTAQPYFKKSRSAKVKDGIINLFLRNYLADRYIRQSNVCQSSVFRAKAAGPIFSHRRTLQHFSSNRKNVNIYSIFAKNCSFLGQML